MLIRNQHVRFQCFFKSFLKIHEKSLYCLVMMMMAEVRLATSMISV